MTAFFTSVPDALSGQVPSPVSGVYLATVLTLSTRHMPDISADLSAWNFGSDPDYGLEWFYAFEEDPSWGDKDIPNWLLKICTVARSKYNANWVLFDPAGDVLDDFPVFNQ